LNGIKDFIVEQREKEEDDSLAFFLEDVALATDLDKDKDDKPRVSLMTIHLAKGLEFPYVFIVGLEENLFPSAMSMNTRSEVEEERRLFYVALTRAEKQVYLSYAQSRYRWGKLVDCDPSRFLEEIDERYIEHLSMKPAVHKPGTLLDAGLFDGPNELPIRFRKPIRSLNDKITPGNFRKIVKMNRDQVQVPVDFTPTSTEEIISELKIGDTVAHSKFGEGKVLDLEGNGKDKKAQIGFESGEVKKLLLQFAKLKIIR